MAKRKIFALDPGHGGKDSGASWSGLLEKNVVLDVCRRVREYIDEHYPDIDCRMTRSKDEFIELRERTKIANGWKSDCFVSVHVNASEASAANGFESFVYLTDDETTKSFALQKKLHVRLAKLWKAKGRADRGMKNANFSVVREFKGASVLVELGFISNHIDNSLLRDKDFLQANAEAIGDAVAEHLGVTKSVTDEEEIYRVEVDGKQVGAYSEPDNVGRQVEQAVRSGKSKVEVTKI